MLRKLLPFLLISAAAIGCGPKGGAPAEALQSPEAFLKWSMDQHKAIKSLQTEVRWKMEPQGNPIVEETRQISYEAPNKFRIETRTPDGTLLTSVSDGTKMLDLSPDRNVEYPAPETLPQVASTQMSHPMFGGSVWYRFFAGASNLDKLADLGKGPITFAGEDKDGDESLKIVRFYAIGTYGHTDAGISTDTGLVHWIKYDSQPLLDLMRQRGAPGPTAVLTTERFGKGKMNETVAATTFAAVAPAGQTVTKAGGPQKQDPPVPIGSPAPDFEVTGLDGKTTKLSSLKGKVVYIDFWATWCPPCVKTLPETQALWTKHGKSGDLAVMAITNERKREAAPFMKEHKFDMPTYLDTKNSAGKAYKVDGIPCFVVVDKLGNLAGFFVGADHKDQIAACLARLGVSP